MSLQQPPQARSSANGYGRRSGSRSENKLQTAKSNPKRSMSSGAGTGGRIGSHETPSRDRLVYLTTCLIGHHVEVQMKNGSIYSGIFHATNAEEEFGIILKMARLIKDEISQGQKESAVGKPHPKTLVIAGKELVQVIAKDVSVYTDGLENEIQRDRQQEILIDSFISQSRHVEVERELEPWIPDEDAPPCPGLENVFDSPWNRNWDQFETNKALFGVESTFNEELYTTKLEKGPQMRGLELEAMRIAREIEGEDTKDLHLAEERGIQLHEDIDIDEETKFSSVYRGRMADDSGYEEEEDIILNSCNNETFGLPSNSILSRSLADFSGRKSNDGAQVSTSSSTMSEGLFTQSSGGIGTRGLGSGDHPGQSGSSLSDKSFPSSDARRIQDTSLREQGGNMSWKELTKDVMSSADAKESKFKGNKYGSDKGGQPLHAFKVPAKSQEKTIRPSTEGSVSSKTQGETHSLNSRGRRDSFTSPASESASAVSASSGPRLSPSSSVGSVSSEKSTLNPYAKEFKLNPNAKIFIPSQTPLRPPSPVSDASYYYPNMSAVPHMQGMPVGMGPSFAGHQPVIYPQAAQVPSGQAYYHPNGPQYGQQMFVGAPRQVMYMPGYPPEMPYKGREF